MNSNSCASQNLNHSIKNPTVNKIRALGKDSIIQIARTLIENNIGEKVPTNYLTKVYTNKDEVYVSFNLVIRYVPWNTASYYGSTVTLISNSFSYSPLTHTNQGQISKSFPFYRISEKDTQNIVFALNSKTGKTWNFENYKTYFENIDTQVTIYEHASFFEVIEETPHERSRYEVTKKTGVVSGLQHRHILNLPPWQEKGFYEIKE